MPRRVLPETAPPRPETADTEPSVWRRVRAYTIQTVLVTLLLSLLAGAGSKLVISPGLFDTAIQALEASAAGLARYELGAGVRLPLDGPGFVGLQRAVARAWRAVGLEGEAARVQAGEEGGFLSLAWTGEGTAGGWHVAALREDGASSAMVWIRASGDSDEGLQGQAQRLLRAARALSPRQPGLLYLRLEGRYGEPLGPAARQALVAGLTRGMGREDGLAVRVEDGPQGARLVIETPEPAPATLPLPSYGQVR